VQQIRFSLIAIALIAGSCVAQDVRYNFANAPFKKFKTYKWVEIKNAQKVDQQKNKQIKDALDAELAKKRLTKTDADTADLYIGYQVGVAAAKQFTQYNPDWGYGPGWSQEGFFGGTYGKNMLPTSTIYAGELAVDMYDPKNRYLIWRGVISETFEPTAPPDDQERILHKSVARLLKKYPPPPLDSLSY